MAGRDRAQRSFYQTIFPETIFHRLSIRLRWRPGEAFIPSAISDLQADVLIGV